MIFFTESANKQVSTLLTSTLFFNGKAFRRDLFCRRFDNGEQDNVHLNTKGMAILLDYMSENL